MCNQHLKFYTNQCVTSIINHLSNFLFLPPNKLTTIKELEIYNHPRDFLMFFNLLTYLYNFCKNVF